MSTSNHIKQVELGELFADFPLDPEGILAFKPPVVMQSLMSALLVRNESGELTELERQNLNRLLAAETVIRVLKAKAFRVIGNSKPQTLNPKP